MTERFYQCEGDNGRCKYHVPGSIITNVLEDMKPQVIILLIYFTALMFFNGREFLIYSPHTFLSVYLLQMQEYDDSNQSKRSFSSTVSEHTKKDDTHGKY